MAFIWDKFTESLNKNIQSEKIWEHLETMYNLEALDESESLPFPNDEKEFYLPEAEFGTLKSRKEEKSDEKKQPQKGRETPKNVKEIKKEEKAAPIKTIKEEKDRSTPTPRKEVLKKEPEKAKIVKGRNSTGLGKDDSNKPAARRPTRNNQKADDSGSSGKGSPVTVTPTAPKRRRL